MTLVEQLRSKKKALTVEELADILCIAIRTLYKEVEDDHIPFFRVRTSIRFDPHQIADWLEGKMPSHSVSPPHRPDAGLRALRLQPVPNLRNPRIPVAGLKGHDFCIARLGFLRSMPTYQGKSGIQIPNSLPGANRESSCRLRYVQY
jgi:excisionase family DNA binding protein